MLHLAVLSHELPGQMQSRSLTVPSKISTILPIVTVRGLF
jgi:hypothetical protein